MKYCIKCVLPDTRPNIVIDHSLICDGCKTSNHKSRDIDWDKREILFIELINKVKNKKSFYDCLIPVSGGKDSTWQVVTALKYGLRPLCITWKTPARNSIGFDNLQNLIGLGVNHIDFSINPIVERMFTLKTFEKIGIPLIPMHMAMHAISLQVAINFKIPLIIWGENSAFEYGGADSELKGFKLNHEWLKKYGVTNGTVSNDWIDDELTSNDLKPYYWPSDREQDTAGTEAIFLGHFFKWDPLKTFQIASEFGFTSGEAPKTGHYNFADIDDEFLITIHHWMKWYKFGFTRLWDNLSLEIRNERMSREEAIKIIMKTGNENPKKEISLFCDYVGITTDNFYKIAEKFRNNKIWSENNGIWEINNFLIEEWNWKNGN